MATHLTYKVSENGIFVCHLQTPVIFTLISAVQHTTTLENSHSSHTHSDIPSIEVNNFWIQWLPYTPAFIRHVLAWERAKKENCFLRLKTTKRRTRYSSYRVEVDCKIFAWLFLKVKAKKQAKYVCIWAAVGWNIILSHANIALASFFGHVHATKQNPFANHTAVAFTLAENQTPRLFLLWSAVTAHRNKQRVVFFPCSTQGLLFSHEHQWQQEQAKPIPG